LISTITSPNKNGLRTKWRRRQQHVIQPGRTASSELQLIKQKPDQACRHWGLEDRTDWLGTNRSDTSTTLRLFE
jgi:hypothetical protein